MGATTNCTAVFETDEIKDDVVIKIEHLKKSFGDKCVLKDINLSLKKGENLGVLGKSGSGKSVLIKCIVKLVEADEGKLIVFGKNIMELNLPELNQIRKKTGFLFQSGALYDSMTVLENLRFPFRDKIHQMPPEEIDSRVQEVLENVGLGDAIDKMPSELSGGMRKRASLARTLILRPEIILYDEPTTGLDPITSKEISKLICTVQKKYNASAIVITHDINCAEITTNRILIINEGIFVAEGTYNELQKSKNKCAHLFFE